MIYDEQINYPCLYCLDKKAYILRIDVGYLLSQYKLNIKYSFSEFQQDRQMSQEKENPQQVENQISIQPSKTSQSLSAQYNTFFANIQTPRDLQQQLLLQLIKNEGVGIRDQYENYLEIKIIRHTANFEALRFQVKICQFCFDVGIFNSNKKSPTHHSNNISNSYSSSIFLNSEALPETAAKCFCKEQENFSKYFVRILKQFCILKVASLLKIGPQMRKTFGFDVVVFKQCVEFCMERCVPIKVMNEKVINQLKLKLRKLHSLRIVHLDIKPDNIAFSPSLDEPVFLDFGFSDVLDQPVGMKTNTAFVGTISYCSPQMIDCYNNQCVSLVDTYHNDIYALGISINELTLSLKQKRHREDDGEEDIILVPQRTLNRQLQLFYKLTAIKYFIFMSKSQLLQNQSYKRDLLKFKNKVIQFCVMLPYSQFLERIFNFYQVNYYQSSLEHNYRPKIMLEKYKAIDKDIRQAQTSDDSNIHSFINGIILNRRFLTNLLITQIGISNLRDIVLNEQVILVIKKQTYFEKFITFIDFHANYSTFAQRVMAAKLMRSILKLSQSQGNVRNSFTDIKICLKYILNFYILLQKQICAEVIPQIWKNLIIIDGFTSDEAIESFKKILNINFPNTKIVALLNMRCFIEVQQANYKKQQNSWILKAYQSIYDISKNNLIQIYSNQNDKNHKLALRIQKLILLSFAIRKPHSQFRQIEEFLQNNQIQMQPSINRQLKIFYYTSAMRHYIQFGRQAQVIKYLQAIYQLESMRRQDCVKIQYYHFIQFKIITALGNRYYVDLLYKKLQACLDNQELFQKYYIHYHVETTKFLFRNYHLLEPYEQFIQFIKQNDLTTFDQRFKCIDFVFNVSQRQEMGKDIERMIGQIYPILRHKIPLSCFKQLNTEIYKLYSQSSYFYLRPLFLTVAMSKIHPSDPQLLLNIDQLILEYKQKWINATDCVYCIQIGQFALARIQDLAFQLKGSYIQAAQVLKVYVSRKNPYYKKQKLGYLITMVANIIRSQLKEKETMQYLAFTYEWVKENDAWVQFIIIQKKQMFQIINRYLMAKNGYDEFFLVQLKFLQIIKAYPADCYIKIYMLQLVDFFCSFDMAKRLIWERCSRQIQKKFQQNDYGVLFYPVLLVQLSNFKDARYKRTMRYICNKIEILSFGAKLIILGHLYFTLIRIYEKDQTNSYSSRLKRYYLKNYLKNSIKDINFSVIKKKMSNLKHSNIVNHTQGIIVKIMTEYLREYHNRCNNLSSDLIQFKYYYPSPFDMDPLYFNEMLGKILQVQIL